MQINCEYAIVKAAAASAPAGVLVPVGSPAESPASDENPITGSDSDIPSGGK